MTMLSELHIDAPPSPPGDARRARRARTRARIDAACELRPNLRTERLDPIRAVLHCYRTGVGGPDAETSPLACYLDTVEDEVALLEEAATATPHEVQACGPTIRRALCFLRGFGRISAVNFARVPIEDRPLLIKLLKLEYRWCFAAAGTTPDIFKIAIGRTGAR